MTGHYRIDYHMHPNFGRSRRGAERRARAWWSAFAQHTLSGVVVTEHSYKRPEESFALLARLRPADATTRIYPGAEIITREGADLIVCAQEPRDLYRHARLLTPYALRYEEAVAEICAHGLFAYVTHPTTIGTTSVLRRRGTAFTRLMIERLGVIERHNAAYLDIAAVCRRLPSLIGGRLAGELEERCATPAALYSGMERVQWVGGSDAHHPSELGSYVALPGTAPQTHGVLWESITTHHDGHFVTRRPAPTAHRVFHQGLSVFIEYLRKQPYHIRMRRDWQSVVAWEHAEPRYEH